MLVSRPAASSVLDGTLYYARDIGVLYANVFTYPSGLNVWEPLAFRSNVRVSGVTTAANVGDYVIATSAINVAAPPSPQTGATFGVAAGFAATGGTPVQIYTEDGSLFYGGGVFLSATILLGSPGASVSFIFDGTNWSVTSGQQDTGWINISTNAVVGYGNPIGNALGTYVPQVKVVGDMARLSQCYYECPVSQTGTLIGSLPAAATPVRNQFVAGGSSSGAFTAEATSSGLLLTSLEAPLPSGALFQIMGTYPIS